MEEKSTQEDEGPYRIRISRADASGRTAPVDADTARRIGDALRHTLTRHDRAECSLSVALVDDSAMTALHDKYLGVAETTDVLTFDLGDGASGAVDGEIIICTDVAARECAARGHALADEITLYAVHGLLHLLGYDDHAPADAAAMHAREDELLTALGVGPIYRGAAP